MPIKIIEYRAKVSGLQIEGHPVQAISIQLLDILDWAKKQCKLYDKPVKIYITREYVLKVIKPKYVKAVEVRKEKENKLNEPLKQCSVCGNYDCKYESHKEYKGRVKDI